MSSAPRSASRRRKVPCPPPPRAAPSTSGTGACTPRASSASVTTTDPTHPEETGSMQIDLRTVSITPLRQTFDHIAARLGADKPASRYIEATMDVQASANLHYRPTWDPEHEIFDPTRTA